MTPLDLPLMHTHTHSESMSAKDVTNAQQKHVFPVFGLPSLLHSDDDCEFVNRLIEEIVSIWPGQMQLITRCQ